MPELSIEEIVERVVNQAEYGSQLPFIAGEMYGPTCKWTLIAVPEKMRDCYPCIDKGDKK